MARYLVTGGAGFIGSHLVDALVKAGESVRVIDNLSTGSSANLEARLGQIEFLEGDLRRPEDCACAVAGVDYVFHHAALASVPKSIHDPMLSHDTNATATLNLLLAARDASVRRFVYAASSSAYGNHVGMCQEEEQVPMPLSPYAASKLAGEHYVRAFAQCHHLPGLSLRYFNVFGPRQDPDSPYSAVIPRFVRAFLSGRPLEVHGDGLQARDFAYVGDIVRANLLAATADVPAAGEVYNIATGESRSVLELIDMLRSLIHAEVPLRHVAPRAGDIRVSCANIARAKRDLGFEVEIPFSEGLHRTVAWYKQDPGVGASSPGLGTG